MTWFLYDPQDIIDLHDDVLNPGELSGMAGDKSLEGVLGRVESRLNYRQIHDVYDLAAAYCLAISQGHVFNDANKRTSFAAMDTCLCSHGVEIDWIIVEIGNKIIEVAQGKINETDLANWLREQ
jgi:death-on-curing protein